MRACSGRWTQVLGVIGLALVVSCGPDPQPLDAGKSDPDTGADAAWEVGEVLVDVAPGEDVALEDVSQDIALNDVEPEPVIACTAGTRAGECLHLSRCDGERESIAGHCPGPADIQCCVARVSTGEQCDANASYEQMPRPNVDLREASGVGGCAPGMVRVAGFCVDRYEAALVEVLGNGSLRSWSPFFNPGTRRVRAVSMAGAVAQGYISGTQARAACTEAGKRLCTDVEWLRACQGPATTTYPYGDARQPGVCNDARAVHPAVEYFGTSDDSIWSRLGNACINQQDDTVTLTGEKDGCVTAEGLFDMMGNVHEWTADASGTFRGGFYVDTVRNGAGCL
ncbi:MAG: SUMF1/EgtB/PvdO family nonheme iron enzyme [Bradymonadaceae bacterium]|nr:SUMF1/EgtB/PvdO family nonheme iron enzyme [Lujinxingiaceae bacterium]